MQLSASMLIVYYLVLLPLSKLPFALLYKISDGLGWFIQHVFKYRKALVYRQLKDTHPQYDQEQLRATVRAFYRHFADIIIESIKLFSITDQDLRDRMEFEGHEQLDAYADTGESILVVGSHYLNWEYVATLCNDRLKHQCVGIYTPLKNAFMDKKLQGSRSRFGIRLLPKKEVKAFFDEKKWNPPVAVFFGSDQSPSRNRMAFETDFLGLPTRVQYGVEKYAIEHRLPVFYFTMVRKKRGYYKAVFREITSHPDAFEYGFIANGHVKALANQIREEPAYWLWSHNRWK